jgi:hypothetical protein
MRVILLLLVWASAAFAEDFRFEITANYWPLNPTGTVLTPTDQVDLKSDLGIQGRKSEALLKVVFKPARKHRLNFEAVPYRFNGANTITRTFTFGGVTFPALVQTQSQIDIDYYLGSYQYDVVSNTRGHAGVAVLPMVRLQVGINVVDADFHNGGNSRGFKLRSAGPIFAVQIHN